MTRAALRSGIPHVELISASGMTLDPSAFVGHDLIVLFSPTDAHDAMEELDLYRRHCADFAAEDAWVIAVTDGPLDVPTGDRGGILALPDHERRAWIAFRDLTDFPEALDRKTGATFLFDRGGNLHRYWHGAGHVDDVVAELEAPAAERYQRSLSC